MARLLHAAQEEQVRELGSIPDERRRCPRCNASSTVYHAVSACVSPEYTERHDFAVYWLLRTILEATGAPEEVRRRLAFGSGYVSAEYDVRIAGQEDVRQRKIKVRAGGPVLADVELYHNKPDVVVMLNNPARVYIFEVAVSHLRNTSVQEQLKRARYAVNSEAHLTVGGLDEVRRGRNLIQEMGRMYRCEARLGVAVVGCFGEVRKSAELEGVGRLLGELGVSDRRCSRMWANVSYSVAYVTLKLLMRRIAEARAARA